MSSGANRLMCMSQSPHFLTTHSHKDLKLLTLNFFFLQNSDNKNLLHSKIRGFLKRTFWTPKAQATTGDKLDNLKMKIFCISKNYEIYGTENIDTSG